MMTLWNAANGASIHAELVGRAWVKQGHELKVFSAKKHPDGRPTSQPDENYVIRHFTVDEVTPFTKVSFFDPAPLLEEDYEVFVAQNVERLPVGRLLELFPKVRKKASTINIVHEPYPPKDSLYYKFKWDAIVCFDHRYKEYLTKYFPEDIIHIIPYPYHPMVLGNKIEARKKLNLPLEKKILFSFGIRARCISLLPPVLREVNEKFPLRYVVVANPGSKVETLRRLTGEYEFMDLRIESIPLNEAYTYLHAADAHLIHRQLSNKNSIVVSSTIFQTLGSGCPILFNDSKYVELQGDEVTKYSDEEDLKAKLAEILQNGFNISKVERLLSRQSSDVIAEKFIQLFKRTRAVHHFSGA